MIPQLFSLKKPNNKKINILKILKKYLHNILCYIIEPKCLDSLPYEKKNLQCRKKKLNVIVKCVMIAKHQQFFP